MKLYTEEQVRTILDLAYRGIIRIKGKEYAPSCNELQEWIDNNQEQINQQANGN